MGCRRMLGALDRAAIMAGVNAGLSQTRIAHLIGHSPSVVCREITRRTSPDGVYRSRGSRQGSPRGQASPEEAPVGL